MEEKRKAKRIVLRAHVIIKRLDGPGNERVPVDVLNISKTGIGFRCDQKLELNSMYEAELVLWTKEVINCFINITREQETEESMIYGGIFVGMTEHDACKIDIYDMFEGTRIE